MQFKDPGLVGDGSTTVNGTVQQAPAPARQLAPSPAPGPAPTGWNRQPTQSAAQQTALKGQAPVQPNPAPVNPNPALETDPAYLAYVRAYNGSKDRATSNEQTQEDALNRSLALQLPQLADINTRNLEHVDNRMETRGLLRSGETVNNENIQREAYGRQVSSLNDQTAQKIAALKSGLGDTLANLDQTLAEQKANAAGRLQQQQAQQAILNGNFGPFGNGSGAASGALGSAGNPIGGAGSPPLVKSAMQWVGEPYQWGGGHGKVGAPKSGTVDCSGLVSQVFGENGINITGTAADMQRKGAPVPSLAQARPGDLVFWGSPAHHVGIYIGNGQMIDAPHTGASVRIESVQGFGSDFAGIRRVA